MNSKTLRGLLLGIRASSFLVLITLFAAPAAAQEPGAVAGRVVLEGDVDPGGVTVTLVELRRQARPGPDRAFRFDGVPPGTYLVLAESELGGTGVAQAVVVPGQVVEVEIHLEVTTVRDEVVVTATGAARRQLDVAQPTTVLSGEDLVLRADTTLGETLSEQPGISSSYFGPGASRPVIRGLAGDRIRVLEGGLGGGDASGTSPDHAVSSEPLTAERIEIIRGPATLLYGSSAVGGVVNVLSGRIPDYLPQERVSGTLHVLGATAADERSGAIDMSGKAGGRLAWHGGFSVRDTDDYEIPGFAVREDPQEDADEEHDAEEELERGILENSSQRSKSGSLGLSWIGDRGFLGVAFSGFDTDYGVPGHGHEEGEEPEGGEEAEEEAVRIDLEQRRIDLQGELLRSGGPFEGLKLRLGIADYEHVELEGAEVGTRFENDTVEGRLDLVQRQRGRLSGTIGLQASSTELVAEGEEAFVPPSTTDLFALFAFEEMDLGRVRLQFGGRWETQDVKPEGGLPDRSFDAVSASVGGVWDLDARQSLAATLSRSERIPTANELFADGPHAATRAFEIGNPDLDKEVSYGLDVSLRRAEGRVTGSLTGFYNRFDDFIFERFTGDVEDGLEVIRFVQRDAEFWGVEAEALVDLYRGEETHLALELSGDTVRAELEETGEPLPRIPPLRLGAALDFHVRRWRAFGEVRWIDGQDRVSPNETPTDGHTLVNGSLSYRFLAGGHVVDLILRGRNLTDEEARVHTSFLKDEAPLPGRDLSFLVGLHF